MILVSDLDLAKYLIDAGFDRDNAIIGFGVSTAESGNGDVNGTVGPAGLVHATADAIGDLGLQNPQWGPSTGIFQIRSFKSDDHTGSMRDQYANLDPAFCARSAYQLFKQAGWKSWSYYRRGARWRGPDAPPEYTLYLDRARAAVDAVLHPPKPAPAPSPPPKPPGGVPMGEPPITLRAIHDSGGGNWPPSRVVIHATCPNVGWPAASRSAYGTALYFQDPNSGGSAHYIEGMDGEQHCVPDGVVAWHAPPNNNSIGIEICGEGGDYPNNYTREQWLSPQVWPAVLLAAARTREVCDRAGIPVRKIGPNELLAGQGGICGHIDVSYAWHQTDHSDPGPTFPWPEFMNAVASGASPIVEEIEDMAYSVDLPPHFPDDKNDYREIVIPITYPGGASGVSRVWVDIVNTDAPLDIFLAHWGTGKHNAPVMVPMLPGHTTIMPLGATGGQEAPPKVYSLVVKYRSPFGASAVIEPVR